MANSKITGLAAGTVKDTDLHVAVDTTDSTMAPTGTNKKYLWSALKTDAIDGLVSGPGSSVDNSVARFDGVDGLTIQESLVTIDDSGNISAPGSSQLFGNSTDASDKQVHVQSVQHSQLWLEGDTGNHGGEGYHPQIWLSQDANNNLSFVGLDNDNQFRIIVSDAFTPTNDFMITVGATVTGGGTPGTLPTLSGGIDAFIIDASTGGIILASTLAVDTINEKTAAAGVTIDGVLLKDSTATLPTIYVDTISEKTPAAGVTVDSVLLKDSSVTFTPIAANPGGVNTLWVDISENIFYGSGGIVIGPATSTNDAIAVYDDVTGKLLKNSVAILNSAGAISGLTLLTVDDIEINGNTISSLNSDQDIILSPEGIGNVQVRTAIEVDEIFEKTTNAGVTIDSVLIKDSQITAGGDVSKFGNSTDGSNKQVHIQSVIHSQLWLEADTGNVGSEGYHPQIWLSQDANNSLAFIGLDNDNQFRIITPGVGSPVNDFMITVGATVTGGGTPGTLPTLSGGIDAFTITPAGDIGIGTTSPAISCILDVTSTTGGIGLPEMTTAQRLLMAPVKATVVFDLDLAQALLWNRTDWVVMG